MEKMQIRTVFEDADLLTIQRLAREIWPGVYGALLGDGQVEYMLNMMYDLEVLRRECSEGVVFLLAEDEGIPVGFASFGAIGDQKFKLHKIYLHNRVRGKGFGYRLSEEVKRRVADLGGTYLTLNVNIHNADAVAAYEKWGLKKLHAVKNAIGNGYYMDDFVMGCVIEGASK